MKMILAIDQGTTGTTVGVVTPNGELIAKCNQEYRQIFPEPGWVEHDPEDIWSSTENMIEAALEKAGISGSDIAAIGITNQRETVAVWDRETGKAIHNAIVWQCRRTASFCDKLKKSKAKVSMIKKYTGLVVDAYFSGSKVKWLLDNVKGARKRADAGDLAMGTVDTFLLWRLTNGEVHATDVTNASRTQLMNIREGNWDEDLLEVFDVPQSLLPEIRPSSGVFGTTKNCKSLPDGIPIAGIAGDQQSALFGQACFGAGEAKCTFGTGSFLLMNTGNKFLPSKNCLTTVAWQLQGEKKLTYALEGSVFICGAAVQWLRDGLGLFSKSSDVESLAESVDSAEGVEFVPALAGLGAPYWDQYARGNISGLTRGTTKAHVARATLEAMALQNCEILWAMEKDSMKKLKTLKVDGGAAANNLLMQLQSDYLGTQVVRPEVVETTAMGAAFLAGLGVGIWKNTSEIKAIWKKDRDFKSEMKPAARKKRVESWNKAIKRSRL